MKRRKSVEALPAGAGKVAECKEKRVAWVKATAAAWREAQRAMDERCGDAVERVSEAEFHRLFEEEQAKVDAYRVPLMDVAERDVWPRELYFGGI